MHEADCRPTLEFDNTVPAIQATRLALGVMALTVLFIDSLLGSGLLVPLEPTRGPAIAGGQRLKPARSDKKCVNARRLIRRRSASISPSSSSDRPSGARPPAWRLHAKSTRSSTAPSDSSTASPTSSPRPYCCGDGSNDGQAGWCWLPVSGMRLAR